MKAGTMYMYLMCAFLGALGSTFGLNRSARMQLQFPKTTERCLFFVFQFILSDGKTLQQRNKLSRNALYK